MRPDKVVVSYKKHCVNGYYYQKKSYSRKKKTANYGVCVRGEFFDNTGNDFYGEIQDIIELTYRGDLGGPINLFMCKWFDSEKRDKGIRTRDGVLELNLSQTTYEDQPFVFPIQASQVYYTPKASRKRERPPSDWQFVLHTSSRIATQGKLVEAYQESDVRSPLHVTLDPEFNQFNDLHGRGEDEEVEVTEDVEVVTIEDEEDELNSDDEETEEEDQYVSSSREESSSDDE